MSAGNANAVRRQRGASRRREKPDPTAVKLREGSVVAGARCSGHAVSRSSSLNRRVFSMDDVTVRDQSGASLNVREKSGREGKNTQGVQIWASFGPIFGQFVTWTKLLFSHHPLRYILMLMLIVILSVSSAVIAYICAAGNIPL